MKLLILQLSDVHCSDRKIQYNNRIKKIPTALLTIGEFDKVILFFSGDLTASGSTNEMKTGRAFIGQVIDSLSNILKCGFINIYIVPGNHDICIPKEGHDSSEILTWNQDKEIHSELDLMKPFFNYAKSKHCFQTDLLVDNAFFEFDGKKIQITLLNSAPFSTRKKDDKELHYFPSEKAAQMERADDTYYKFTIMHHSYEWFEWYSKEMLKKSMFSDDIVFFGHDHKPEQISMHSGEGHYLNYIVGGEFSLNGENCAFNAIVVDTDTDEMDCHEFSWDNNKEIFMPKKKYSFTKNKISLSPSESYVNKLLSGNRQISALLTDYYVLPDLKVKGEFFSEDSEISSINEDIFFSKLVTEKVIRITGENNSGKTALLKYLYSVSISKGLIPLFLNVKSNLDNDLNKILKHLFEEQYDEKWCFEQYQQQDHTKEIIFIDNLERVDNIKAKSNLIREINSTGRLLVYVYSDISDEIQNIIKDKLDGRTIGTLEIRPFYKESRDRLVEKICKIKDVPDDDMESLIVTLDYMAQCQPNLFTLAPDNLIQYIIFLLKEKTKRPTTQNTISMVFETNTRNQLLNVIQDSDLVIYMSLLGFISSYMYFDDRTDAISFEILSDLVISFNKMRKAYVSAKIFWENCQKANILIEEEDDFRIKFCNNNLFAFFVASSIKRDIEKDSNNIFHLEKVVRHICFGINDLIILFLSYMLNNNRLIMRIATQSFEFLKESPFWSIEEQNLPFLNQIDDTARAIPTSEEREDVKRNQELVEQKRHEEIQLRKPFDYSDEEVEKLKTFRALKCIQIIARLLVDQYGLLDADEVDEIIEYLYDIPPKIIYANLLPVQNQIKEMCEYFYSYAQKHSDAEISKDEIKKMLGNIGLSIALNTLYNVAYNASANSTIQELKKHKTITMAQEVMKLLLVENTRNTMAFVDCAIELSKKNDNSFLQKIISLIARTHILCSHKPIEHTQISRLVSANILSQRGKTNILIQTHTQKGTPKKSV